MEAIGVSLKVILDACDRYKLNINNNNDDDNNERNDLTTTDVCNRFIMPETIEKRCSYADYLLSGDGNGSSNSGGGGDSGSGNTGGGSNRIWKREEAAKEIGRATVFVSHAWKYVFVDVVKLLVDWCDEDRSGERRLRTRFWFDVLVNNQHGTGERPFEWWTTTFTNCVKDIGHTLVIMSPWDAPIYVTRAWCLFELYITAKSNTKHEILLPKGDEEKFVEYLIYDYDSHGGVFNKISHIDIEKAEAFKQEDLENIKEMVRSTLDGGFTTLNKSVFEELRKWIVMIAEKALKNMDESNPSKRHLQGNLASILSSMGRHEEALSLHKDNLEKRIAASSSSSSSSSSSTRNVDDGDNVVDDDGMLDIDVALSLCETAAALCDKANYDEAEPLYKKSIKIYSRIEGEDSVDVAIVMSNLAELYKAKLKYSDAEPMYLRALEIIERECGANHGDVAGIANNLADLYRLQQRYEEAANLFKRALAIDTEVYGNNHPNVALDFNNLANVYREQEKYDEAEPLFKNAISITEKVSGENHPDVGVFLLGLGAFYYDKKNYIEAKALFKRALTIFKNSFGDDHPRTESANDFLARVYEEEADNHK